MELDIAIEAEWPREIDWDELAARVADAVARVAPELASDRLATSLVFTDNNELRILNRDWRGKDKPTNVLSFPMLGRDDLLDLDPDGPPVLIGDVALALETCAREAEERGIAIADHAAHLVAHGLLHLAGHDHETGEDDAVAMEALETKALALLGLADPYGRLD